MDDQWGIWMGLQLNLQGLPSTIKHNGRFPWGRLTGNKNEPPDPDPHTVYPTGYP